MRKTICSLISCLLMCVLLTGCGDNHEHIWSDATCQSPKTCTECGATEGTTLPHEYGLWGNPEKDSTGQWVHSRTCIICADKQTEQTEGKNYGSAGFVEGNTVIVSIFASELNTSWNFENKEDCNTRDFILKNMKSATSWLTQEVGKYNVQSKFIYDWEANSDLLYTYDFGEQLLVRDDVGGYTVQENYVLNNIPTDALKKKYQADNILYMFYFNTDETNSIAPWTISDQNNVETEIVNIFARHKNYNGYKLVLASPLAHEIMHCFGARDLYYASNDIPWDYVSYCKSNSCMDIMFTTKSLDSEINQMFTQVDAYYMGLVDSCKELTTWGLGKSSFAD